MRSLFFKNLTSRASALFAQQQGLANALPALGDEGRAERIIRSTMSLMLMFAPLLAVALLMLAAPIAAHAQTPGGQIFGASDQTIGNGFKAFCKYFRVIIFFVGFVFMGLVGICKGVGKPWGGFLAGGLICWGFAGLAQLGYSFATGNEVEITPDID